MRCDVHQDRIVQLAPHFLPISWPAEITPEDRHNCIWVNARSTEDHNVRSTNSLGCSGMCHARWSGTRHGAVGAGGHACADPGAVAGGHRPWRSAGATLRGCPAAAIGTGPGNVLAPGSLDVGRRELGLVPGPIYRAACAAGGVAARTLGAAADRRLCLGRRPLGRLTMVRVHPACLALPALVALFGCGRSEPPPRTTQIIVQPPAQQAQAAAVIAPGPPPPPQSELVPTPPVGVGPVVWQPGHWLLSGNNWAWQPRAICAAAARPDDMGARPVVATAWRRLDVGGGALGLSTSLRHKSVDS